MITDEELVGRVWFVEEYCDQVKERDAKDASKRIQREERIYRSNPHMMKTRELTFTSQDQAFKFVIERAEKSLETAEEEVKHAQQRLKKCRKKFFRL